MVGITRFATEVRPYGGGCIEEVATVGETQTKIARHVRISGHVQGVFFRASTRDRATSRGVTGWIRNNPDGTVEAVLEGGPDDVEAIESWMRGGGPSRARVEDVTARDVEPEGATAFEVRH